MIELSRLSGQKFVLNGDQIKYLEATPDTLITLMTGEKLMVKEPVERVISLVMNFRKQLYQEPPQVLSEGDT